MKSYFIYDVVKCLTVDEVINFKAMPWYLESILLQEWCLSASLRKQHLSGCCTFGLNFAKIEQGKEGERDCCPCSEFMPVA